MFLYDVKQYAKRIFISADIYIGMLICLAGISLVFGAKLEELIGLVEIWPAELTALCGIGNIYAKPSSLMIFYMGMILCNMIAMGMAVSSVVTIFKADEERHLMGFYLNQPYTKNQIFLHKTLLAVIAAVVQWYIYIGFIGGAVYGICTRLSLSFETEIQDILNIGVEGTVFLLFYLALTMFYASFKDISMTYGSFMMIVLGVVFVLGNVYKGFDLVAYYMRAAQENAVQMERLAETFESLRILFPFTLLNVLNVEASPLPEGVYFIYGMLATVLFFVCWYRYHRDSLS